MAVLEILGMAGCVGAAISPPRSPDAAIRFRERGVQRHVRPSLAYSQIGSKRKSENVIAAKNGLDNLV